MLPWKVVCSLMNMKCFIIVIAGATSSGVRRCTDSKTNVVASVAAVMKTRAVWRFEPDLGGSMHKSFVG